MPSQATLWVWGAGFPEFAQKMDVNVRDVLGNPPFGPKMILPSFARTKSSKGHTRSRAPYGRQAFAPCNLFVPTFLAPPPQIAKSGDEQKERREVSYATFDAHCTATLD